MGCDIHKLISNPFEDAQNWKLLDLQQVFSFPAEGFTLGMTTCRTPGTTGKSKTKHSKSKSRCFQRESSGIFVFLEKSLRHTSISLWYTHLLWLRAEVRSISLCVRKSVLLRTEINSMSITSHRSFLEGCPTPEGICISVLLSCLLFSWLLILPCAAAPFLKVHFQIV